MMGFAVAFHVLFRKDQKHEVGGAQAALSARWAVWGAQLHNAAVAAAAAACGRQWRCMGPVTKKQHASLHCRSLLRSPTPSSPCVCVCVCVRGGRVPGSRRGTPIWPSCRGCACRRAGRRVPSITHDCAALSKLLLTPVSMVPPALVQVRQSERPAGPGAHAKLTQPGERLELPDLPRMAVEGARQLCSCSDRGWLAAGT